MIDLTEMSSDELRTWVIGLLAEMFEGQQARDHLRVLLGEAGPERP